LGEVPDVACAKRDCGGFRNFGVQSAVMKKLSTILLLAILLMMADIQSGDAQCSICTRTAQQLGERPAKALNKGIIYLALTPLVLFGIIGYRWWKSEQNHD
jgi:hypothetical protein